LSEHFLDSIRYAGDRSLFEQLRGKPELQDSTSGVQRDEHRKSVRKRLLASAVRVNKRLLPKLDESIRAVQERARYDAQIEAYIFEEPNINAFLTSGMKHTYLGLSSGAVNTLSAQELEFVIGHELGHALFGHLEANFSSRLNDDALETRSRQELLSWKRAGEISADRCGLVCCGSLDVAATAMFRTLSGLSTPGLSIHPNDFSEQWDHLLTEVIETGDEDMWKTTHPFPPMRMKAMVRFWQSDSETLPKNREYQDAPVSQVDDEVARMLAAIDPLARSKSGASDPLLEDVVLWAGLAVAHASEHANGAVLERLRKLVPVALAAHPSGDELSKADCMAHLKQALASRSKRLRSTEIHRVLSSVLALGTDAELQDGNPFWRAFLEVGKEFGVNESGCVVVRDRHQEAAQR